MKNLFYDEIIDLYDSTYMVEDKKTINKIKYYFFVSIYDDRDNFVKKLIKDDDGEEWFIGITNEEFDFIYPYFINTIRHRIKIFINKILDC